MIEENIPKLIGDINLSSKEPFIESAVCRLNLPFNVGQCNIYVYSNEGTIPHFHIIPKNGIGESCICIYEPFYFNHCSKQMQLNSKQRKLLDDWMYLKPSLFPEINNWELIEIIFIGLKVEPKSKDAAATEATARPMVYNILIWVKL